MKKSPSRRGYDAAMISPLTSDWAISPLSADAEIRRSFRILRARSRELARNDPYTRNYLRLARNNVVGSSGIKLQMKIQDGQKTDPKTGKTVTMFDADAGAVIEQAWKTQCRKENYCVTRNLTEIETDGLILNAVLGEADCLIRKVRGYKNRYGFALQLFEGDYLDEMYNDFRTLANGNEVRMGVELDKDWRFPVAYWLLASHPGDFQFGPSVYARQRIRIPVEDIIHPFIPDRIGQTRGTPATAAAMQRLNYLGGYDEAELVAARAGAQKMGFLYKDVPENYEGDFEDSEGNRTIDSSPGQIEELPMGYKFQDWDPTHPNAQYGPFTKAQLRGIAAALGVSYTSLANDLEGVNFSSIRAGLLEERENWRVLQRWLIDTVKIPVFEDWLMTAMMHPSGIPLPLSKYEKFNAPEFQARRWPWVDPEKDIAAAMAAIAGKLDTRSNIIAEHGGNFEEVVAELAYEQEVLEAAGLNTPPPAPAPAQPAKQKDQEQ